MISKCATRAKQLWIGATFVHDLLMARNARNTFPIGVCIWKSSHNRKEN